MGVDSYGYRPGRSPLDAVATCRQRCWRYPWVIDLDIAGFFDNLDHDLVLEAVAHHLAPDQNWILLYVRRWFEAGVVGEGGSVTARDRGSAQGAAISQLLANLRYLVRWATRKYKHLRRAPRRQALTLHSGTRDQHHHLVHIHCHQRHQAETASTRQLLHHLPAHAGLAWAVCGDKSHARS